ncbi:type III polyketide synthase [Paenibacillus nasutitermitis]|nr:type III polyketide synthase [Paenibacillus nasutitermitis]
MEHTAPGIAILGIGTAVPDYKMEQNDVSQRLSDALKDYSDSRRWAKRIFKQCAVETRYTCEPNLLEDAANCRYFPHNYVSEAPSTAQRMQLYKREAVPLGLKAAQAALQDGGIAPSEITHLITVSCTGQFLPGMDALLTRKLGLSPTVNRIPLQFLGCAAGLKAICLANQLVCGDSSAHVLIVSVELCTLHIQPSSQREALYAASFFGDGASSCVVGPQRAAHRGCFQLGPDYTVLLPGSLEEMVWEIGAHGFDLYLSTAIPKLIGQFIPEEVSRFLKDGFKPSLWAIHPGGRGIIDALKDAFALTEEQTRPSRAILRDYGNMSSATILFVLEEIRQALREGEADDENGIAMAFGPGLTVEMVRFTYLPSAIPNPLQVETAGV